MLQPASCGCVWNKKSTPISLVYDLNFGGDNRIGLCKRLVPDVYGLKIHGMCCLFKKQNWGVVLVVNSLFTSTCDMFLNMSSSITLLVVSLQLPSHCCLMPFFLILAYSNLWQSDILKNGLIKKAYPFFNFQKESFTREVLHISHVKCLQFFSDFDKLL